MGIVNDDNNDMVNAILILFVWVCVFVSPPEVLQLL